ncbi:MAG: heme-binding protein, partial [Sphingobacteriales bacterium]
VKKDSEAENQDLAKPVYDLPYGLAWPDGLKVNTFTGPGITPSPACLAVAATGEVFVGIDLNGSLGKGQGRGKILKLIDNDNDGKPDVIIEFAPVDNPRGIIAIGDQVFVLHTAYDKAGMATGMDLVVFEDKDKDGKADGPSKLLVERISNTRQLQERGADHATNGIRMGIDGWIYIAVGDYGFYNATDRSGTKLTMLGGGVVRVRTDGTGLETFTHGTRNIYDVSIDPLMNIFTRDNTNDGGGWNIRFSHQIQSGEYGYPTLFQHFTDEILPALADLGGGSGTGALYMDEESWPQKYNHVNMMADWGRNRVFIHRVTPDGPSFKQTEEEFIELPQVTDLDVDGSGRLYLAAWDGAGFSGDSSKGYVIRAVPANWTYKRFSDVKKASVKELASLLKSASAVARLNASQELLNRPAQKAGKILLDIIEDKELPLYARVAGLYTYAQLKDVKTIPALMKFADDAQLKEFALRILTDRTDHLSEVPVALFIRSLKDTSVRVRLAAITGLGRLGKHDAIQPLLQTEVPANLAAPEGEAEGPHATPNAAIIPAHIAMQALVRLNAVDDCVQAIGTKNTRLALWALRYMHSEKAVAGLIAAYQQTNDGGLKKQLLVTLARLYKREAAYDGSWWWATRPDSHGPYYKAELWAGSAAIEQFLKSEQQKADATGKQFFAILNGRNRMGIDAFGGEETIETNEAKVDLEKIRNQKGQIGKTSIEDIMIAIAKIKGDPLKGKGIFLQQGCVACHTLTRDEKLKGPFMGQIGAIMNREQIAEAILKPNASISQGFASVLISAKGGKSYMGFITASTAEKIVMRNITGEVFTIKTSDILSRKEMETSMMPTGMANSLSYEEFA